jgi:DNA-binding transcriptional ArsR family regulator
VVYHAEHSILEPVNEQSLDEALNKADNITIQKPQRTKAASDDAQDGINEGAFNILCEGMHDKAKAILRVIIRKRQANIEELIEETQLPRRTLYRHIDTLKEKRQIIVGKDLTDSKRVIFKLSDDIFRKVTAK